MTRLYLVARDGERLHSVPVRKHRTPDRPDPARIVAEAYDAAEKVVKSGQDGMQVLKRLWRAIYENDQVAAHALIRHAQAELGYTVLMSGNLAALFAPPKSKANKKSSKEMPS
jgi:hypothetical protein